MKSKTRLGIAYTDCKRHDLRTPLCSIQSLKSHNVARFNPCKAGQNEFHPYTRLGAKPCREPIQRVLQNDSEKYRARGSTTRRSKPYCGESDNLSTTQSFNCLHEPERD